MSEWKDSTTYRQGERGTTEPTAWSFRLGIFAVSITKGHIYYPDIWIARIDPHPSIYKLGYADKMDADTAKSKAMALARKTLKEACAALPKE